ISASSEAKEMVLNAYRRQRNFHTSRTSGLLRPHIACSTPTGVNETFTGQLGSTLLIQHRCSTPTGVNETFTFLTTCWRVRVKVLNAYRRQRTFPLPAIPPHN